MLIVDSMLITKETETTGDVSIKLIDTELLDGEKVILLVNGLLIDMNNTIEPVGIPKNNGTPIISGNLVGFIINLILQFIEETVNEKGSWRVNNEGFMQKLR